MRFPPEIVSLIVQQVRLTIEDERLSEGITRVGGPVNASTFDCALVCLEWAAAALPHLYYPHLQVEWSYRTGKNLAEALERNARYLPLVTRVDARYQDLDEVGELFIARIIDGWSAEHDREPISESVREQMEQEAQQEWELAVEAAAPESLWAATPEGLVEGSRAFWDLLSEFPRLRQLGVRDFPHGPAFVDATASASAGATRDVLAAITTLAILGSSVKIGTLGSNIWEHSSRAHRGSQRSRCPHLGNDESPTMWLHRRNPPQLPVLTHLTIHDLCPPVFDILRFGHPNGPLALTTFIYRRDDLFLLRPDPPVVIAHLLRSLAYLDTVELPTRTPLPIYGPLPEEKRTSFGSRSAWDVQPFDTEYLDALRTTSLRHFVIGEPLTPELILNLPPTLESLEYRVRSRVLDELDAMVDGLVALKSSGRVSGLELVREEEDDVSRRTGLPLGAYESLREVPAEGEDEERRRTTARIAKAASAGITLEVFSRVL